MHLKINFEIIETRVKNQRRILVPLPFETCEETVTPPTCTPSRSSATPAYFCTTVHLYNIIGKTIVKITICCFGVCFWARTRSDKPLNKSTLGRFSYMAREISMRSINIYIYNVQDLQKGNTTMNLE